MSFWGPLGVAWFELRRSLSVGRVGLWFLLALFPVLLAFLVTSRTGGQVPEEQMVLILFFVIVRVTCVMGLLLWATPVVNDEIEGRTWIYIATRPGGSRSLVLGKYLVAVGWSITSGVTAATISVMVGGMREWLLAIATLSALVVLACVAYGSLFVFVGALIQRRAMVAAIIYVMIIEGVMSLLPATINRFTVGYRLLSLLMDWMDYAGLMRGENLRMMYGESAPVSHIAILALYSIVLLGLAILRVRMGGYLTDPED